MRVLVTGSGGREHALAWKIGRSPLVERVLVAPGSDGMAADADCFPGVAVDDATALVELARREAVDLIVIGPEDPIAAGLGDRLREAGFDVFAPSRRAAQLEGSKAFAKAFMARHGVPTAAYAEFEALEPALAYVREQGGRCVVKADGLAAGKGVTMCATVAEAESALQEIMGDRRFGEAGDRVVIEEWMDGEEASYHAISDGERIVSLASAQDHKRALDGDEGENTGGMGAYSPAPVVTETVEKRVLEEIVHPTIRGMAAEGNPFVGVLYVGLMIDDEGSPRVVEFNVRFGDPETQPLLLRMEGDIVPLLHGAARGALDPSRGVSWGDPAVCVVLAAGGYPRSPEKGRRIRGLAVGQTSRDDEIAIFHSGTRIGEHGDYETAGGRVLGVTASGADVAAARERAYATIDEIEFENMAYRRDIASRALGR